MVSCVLVLIVWEKSKEYLMQPRQPLIEDRYEWPEKGVWIKFKQLLLDQVLTLYGLGQN